MKMAGDVRQGPARAGPSPTASCPPFTGYRAGPAGAGFAAISITATHQVADGQAHGPPPFTSRGPLSYQTERLGVNEAYTGLSWALLQITSLDRPEEVGEGRLGCCTFLLYVQATKFPRPCCQD
jgi:hypothetical protein